MRSIYSIFLLAFWGLLLNCNNTKLKEPELQKAVEKTETKETFSLVKPINKPEEPLYHTLYNGYSVSMKSNSDHQELIFKKGNVETKKTLKLYYENPEIVFHLYRSDADNIVLLIEGRDYYGSNLGIYYIENKTNRIIEVDDTLSYTQDAPEIKGFKLPKAEIIKKGDELKCTIYLENKLLYDKNYNISTIEKNKNIVSSKVDNQSETVNAAHNTTPSDRDYLPSLTNTISKNDTKLSSTLKDWEGVYLNSDDKSIKTYQSILNKVGWFKLKITAHEIIFSADTRMRDNYPQSDPGGVYINNSCNYYISNNTIEIYKKKYDDPNSTPVNIRGNKKDLLITLYQKDKVFYGTSDVIEDSEHYDNSARIKSKTPYQFYKFSLEEDKD